MLDAASNHMLLKQKEKRAAEHKEKPYMHVNSECSCANKLLYLYSRIHDSTVQASIIALNT